MAIPLKLSPHFKASPITYKRVGALRFLRVGTFTASWSFSKPKPAAIPQKRVALATASWGR